MSQFRCRPAVFALVAQIIGIAVAANAPALAQEALYAGQLQGICRPAAWRRGSAIFRASRAALRQPEVRRGQRPGRAEHGLSGTLELCPRRPAGDRRPRKQGMADDPRSRWATRSGSTRASLAPTRTAITTDNGLVYREPSAGSGRVAKFSAGAVVSLGDCGNVVVPGDGGRPQGLGPAFAPVGRRPPAGCPRKKLGFLSGQVGGSFA